MRRLGAVAALQILIILGWAVWNERVRATAPTFRIPLQPSDPFDIVRGRYFVLNPVDGAIKTGRSESLLAESEVRRFLGSKTFFNGPALVGFCPHGSLQRVCALATRHDTPPAGPVRYWSRAFVTIQWEDKVWRDGRQVVESGFAIRVDLRLHRFFVPNRIQLPARETDQGWELEVCHRPGLSPLPRRLWFKGEPLEYRERIQPP